MMLFILFFFHFPTDISIKFTTIAIGLRMTAIISSILARIQNIN